MRIRVIVGIVAVAAVLAVLAALYLPEMRLRAGLESAGVPRPVAACMAKRMVKRLSWGQLWKLADLPAARGSRTRKDFLHDVRALGDPEIDAVTISSFAICGVGSLL